MIDDAKRKNADGGNVHLAEGEIGRIVKKWGN